MRSPCLPSAMLIPMWRSQRLPITSPPASAASRRGSPRRTRRSCGNKLRSELATAEFLPRLNEGLQPVCKMDRCFLHRIVPGIADLLDVRMRIEFWIDAPHQVFANAIVEFAEQHEHRGLDLVGIGGEVVLDEGAHIAPERL